MVAVERSRTSARSSSVTFLFNENSGRQGASRGFRYQLIRRAMLGSASHSAHEIFPAKSIYFSHEHTRAPAEMQGVANQLCSPRGSFLPYRTIHASSSTFGKSSTLSQSRHPAATTDASDKTCSSRAHQTPQESLPTICWREDEIAPRLESWVDSYTPKFPPQ